MLFNNYGLLRCGYTPEESAQGQIYEQVTATKNTGKIIAIVALSTNHFKWIILPDFQKLDGIYLCTFIPLNL